MYNHSIYNKLIEKLSKLNIERKTCYVWLNNILNSCEILTSTFSIPFLWNFNGYD